MQIRKNEEHGRTIESINSLYSQRTKQENEEEDRRMMMKTTEKDTDSFERAR